MFATVAQRECYEKILPWIRDEWGGAVHVEADAPEFVIVHGSIAARVGVYPAGDEEAIIRTRAYVALGPDPGPDLAEFLLRRNGSLHFAAFGMDGEGNIFLEHTLLGSTCNPAELLHSVRSVVRHADEHDDLINDFWDGLGSIPPE